MQTESRGDIAGRSDFCSSALAEGSEIHVTEEGLTSLCPPNKVSLNRQEIIPYCIFRQPNEGARGGGGEKREGGADGEGRRQICEYIPKLDRNLSNFSPSYERPDAIKPAITPRDEGLLAPLPFISTSWAIRQEIEARRSDPSETP